MKFMVYRYILFNKPYNVLSQFTDNRNVKHRSSTLKEYISVDLCLTHKC